MFLLFEDQIFGINSRVWYYIDAMRCYILFHPAILGMHISYFKCTAQDDKIILHTTHRKLTFQIFYIFIQIFKISVPGIWIISNDTPALFQSSKKVNQNFWLESNNRKISFPVQYWKFRSRYYLSNWKSGSEVNSSRQPKHNIKHKSN